MTKDGKAAHAHRVIDYCENDHSTKDILHIDCNSNHNSHDIFSTEMRGIPKIHKQQQDGQSTTEQKSTMWQKFIPIWH